MLLLAIAHKGEAQTFIKRKFTQTVDFYFSGLYRSDNEILLLTGEGIQKTTVRITAVCAYYGHRIDRLINMGIAASLDSSLQLNQIYGIRSVYHEFTGENEYPSFKCMETRSKVDCVTACKRVVKKEYGHALRKIAPVADRELWGIGSVCHQFRIPFKSYKLISDYADEKTNLDQIRSMAPDYSKHLFDFYKKLSLTKDI